MKDNGYIGEAILSIIIGIIAAVIYYSFSAFFLITGVWIVLGIAIGVLVAMIVLAYLKANRCIYWIAKRLIYASIGTIISSIFALTVLLNLTLASILVGIIVFFFSFMILSLVSLLKFLLRD